MPAPASAVAAVRHGRAVGRVPADPVPALLSGQVIDGGRVALRRLDEADQAKVGQWDADRELVDLYGGPPSDLALQDGGLVLAIVAGERLVGIVGLTGEAWRMGSAELRILLGERSDRGLGYGREAIRAFLAYVFEHSSLDFVYLRVFRRNGRAIRCYEKCGFQRSGRLKVCSDQRYASPAPDDDLLLMTYRRGPGAAEVATTAAEAVLP